MPNLDWTPPTLKTPRLILRPLTIDDAVDVFLYASNPNVARHVLWNTHETIDDTIIFLRDYVQSRYVNQEPDPLGITLQCDPTKSVIGALGCFWSSKKDGVMELGYTLAEPYWGQGLVAEAARALIEWVFAEYPIERIQARVFSRNPASERVAQKIGMTYEGTLRSSLLHRGERIDLRYYSILRGDLS